MRGQFNILNRITKRIFRKFYFNDTLGKGPHFSHNDNLREKGQIYN